MSNQQVLSKSVGEAFAYYGDDDTAETERFVTIFNKFFDLMNTRSLEEEILKLNRDLGPSRKADDPRLKVMSYGLKYYCSSSTHASMHNSGTIHVIIVPIVI